MIGETSCQAREQHGPIFGVAFSKELSVSVEIKCLESPFSRNITVGALSYNRATRILKYQPGLSQSSFTRQFGLCLKKGLPPRCAALETGLNGEERSIRKSLNQGVGDRQSGESLFSGV